MQLFSIGVGERDTGIKEALFRKIRSRKPDGLDIEEKKQEICSFSIISVIRNMTAAQ